MVSERGFGFRCLNKNWLFPQKNISPGRFFAVAEMKTVIAQILLNYDIKLTDEEAGRPQSLHIAGLVHPSRTGKVSLKKRVLTTG